MKLETQDKKKLHASCFMLHEEGVTLVVAVVMLAAVTFISFSIATVVIRETNAARLILRTEPAISGANSGGEVGLYRLLREFGNTTTQGQLRESGATYQITPELYVDPYQFSFTGGDEFTIGLYDAENTSKTTNNYQSVNVTNTANSPFKVAVYSWADTKNTFCAERTITQGNVYTCTLNHATDDRYIVVIESLSGTATGQVSATRADGSPGIPAPDPEMEITGRSGNVQRKIEINLQSQ